MLENNEMMKIGGMSMEKHYSELAKKLMINAYKEKEGENVVCSPFSFYMLLGIALNAVRGKCQDEIKDMLTDEADVSSVTEYISKLEKNISQKFEDGSLISSNGICIKKDLYDHILNDFKELMQEDFRAEIFSAESDIVDKVNNWVNEKTEGMIPKLLEESPKDLKAVLMNAISFKAKWETPYEAEDIEEESEFTNYDGSVSEVTMLRSDEKEYIQDGFYTGFVKNYKGGKYSFMALLPKKTAKSFQRKAIEQIDFKAYYDSRYYSDVVARMPEFEISANMELTEFCQSLGIRSIFKSDADFCGMTKKEPLMVNAVIQKAFIKVDRDGTEAAAVSAMCVYAGCAPDFENIKFIELDRPFVYAIVDRESGLPVFSGVVNKL